MMGRYIVKLKDRYLEYSTIVDAPVTSGMTLEAFREYYREQYGREGMRELDERLARVERYGSSDRMGHTAEQVLSGNRAGPDETELTLDEIYTAYCEMQPLPNGWAVKWID